MLRRVCDYIPAQIRRRVGLFNLRGLALDIGGTGFRVAPFEIDRRKGKITFSGETKRESTPNVKNQTDVEPANLPGLLAAKIAQIVESYGSIDLIGASFAGPVTRDGVVVKAPNIWGKDVGNVALAQMVQDETGVRPLIANDMVPMAFREAVDGEAGREGVSRFTIITVSSGVGSANFETDHVPIGEMGVKGEIGHFVLPQFPKVECGCGGFKHLESFASGNAAQRIAQELAVSSKAEAYRKSPINDWTNGDPTKITGEHISRAQYFPIQECP